MGRWTLERESLIDVTLLAVLGFRDNLVLDRFITRFRHFHRQAPAPTRVQICEARNEIVDLFMDSRLDYLLMMDDDMLPDERVLPLLDSSADVAGAAVLRAGGENGLQHGHYGGFACPCVRLSRRACASLPKPIFLHPPNTCECRRLWNMATRTGMPPQIIGVIQHP